MNANGSDDVELAGETRHAGKLDMLQLSDLLHQPSSGLVHILLHVVPESHSARKRQDAMAHGSDTPVLGSLMESLPPAAIDLSVALMSLRTPGDRR